MPVAGTMDPQDYRFSVWKKLDDALGDLNDALSYGSQAYLGEAIALGDNYPSTHYLLTAALWHERDCGFVETADDYMRLCANNRKCKSEMWNGP